MGRPKTGPTFSTEIQDAIINRIAAGETLRAICRTNGFPKHSTVLEWVSDPVFADRYARARRSGLDVIAEEIIDIADDSSGDVTFDAEGNERQNSEFTNRSRLRVDARKWLLSKLRPDKYGDHLTLAGDQANPLIPPKITVEFVQAIARPIAPELPEGE